MVQYVIVFLTLFCIFLLSVIYNYRKNTQKIISVLRENRLGNLNRRTNLKSANRLMSDVSEELNSLADRFDETILMKTKLENSQKKLISNISHDLRTPLTSMLGYIEVLKEDKEMTPLEIENYLNIIETKGKVLYKLVQDFFEISKLEAEDVVFKFQRINICAKLKEVITEFYNDFTDMEIEPVITIPEHSIYVWCDETGVHRIMHNLLSNALNYGSEGKIIGIELREEKDKIWIDVWDRGKGIAESDLNHIFDRLYTVESSRNDKLRGNGLGLAIVKKLAAKMNIEVTVSSIPWEKTIFSLSILKYK